MMRRLARWHIWLGWIAAVPVLLWLVSGLFMAARPIEEVRGEHLRRAAVPIPAQGLTFPTLTTPVSKLALVDQAGRATWVITGADKAVHRYDARSGAVFGPVNEAEARDIIASMWAGKAKLSALKAFAAKDAPFDLRRPRPSWQASFDDGTRVYVDAESGEVLAVRTRFWRVYDFLWGLHIMDPDERENAHNPWVWSFGALALISSLLGSVLLFRRRKRGR